MERLSGWVMQALRSTLAVARMRHIEQITKPRVLFDLRTREAAAAFKVISDKEIGGSSQVEFAFDEVNRCATLQGTLDLTVPQRPNVVQSGYAAIVSPQYKPALDLDGYSGLLIRARTDGRVYVANIRVNAGMEDDVYQSFFTTEPYKWTDVHIPFDRFLLTWHGYVEGQNSLLPTSRIKSIGILMAERKSGPFYCQLEAIAASPPGSTQRGSSKRYTIVESSSNFRE